MIGNNDVIQQLNDNVDALCLVGRFDAVTAGQLEAIRVISEKIGAVALVVIMPDAADCGDKKSYLESRGTVLKVLQDKFPLAQCLLLEDAKGLIDQCVNVRELKVICCLPSENDEASWQMDIKALCGHLQADVEFSSALREGYELEAESKGMKDMLFSGDVAGVNAILQRIFFLAGPVVHGAQNGRKMGFPTANIKTGLCQAIPADGVYAVKVVYEGKEMMGMANIGYRPTFEGCDRSVEVNIFDFDDDIYDKYLELYFHARIREERKFASMDDLKKQIETDKSRIREYFADIK